MDPLDSWHQDTRNLIQNYDEHNKMQYSDKVMSLITKLCTKGTAEDSVCLTRILEAIFSEDKLSYLKEKICQNIQYVDGYIMTTATQQSLQQFRDLLKVLIRYAHYAPSQSCMHAIFILVLKEKNVFLKREVADILCARLGSNFRECFNSEPQFNEQVSCYEYVYSLYVLFKQTAMLPAEKVLTDENTTIILQNLQLINCVNEDLKNEIIMLYIRQQCQNVLFQAVSRLINVIENRYAVDRVLQFLQCMIRCGIGADTAGDIYLEVVNKIIYRLPTSNIITFLVHNFYVQPIESLLRTFSVYIEQLSSHGGTLQELTQHFVPTLHRLIQDPPQGNQSVTVIDGCQNLVSSIFNLYIAPLELVHGYDVKEIVQVILALLEEGHSCSTLDSILTEIILKSQCDLCIVKIVLQSGEDATAHHIGAITTILANILQKAWNNELASMIVKSCTVAGQMIVCNLMSSDCPDIYQHVFNQVNYEGLLAPKLNQKLFIQLSTRQLGLCAGWSDDRECIAGLILQKVAGHDMQFCDSVTKELFRTLLLNRKILPVVQRDTLLKLINSSCLSAPYMAVVLPQLFVFHQSVQARVIGYHILSSRVQLKQQLDLSALINSSETANAKVFGNTLLEFGQRVHDYDHALVAARIAGLACCAKLNKKMQQLAQREYNRLKKGIGSEADPAEQQKLSLYGEFILKNRQYTCPDAEIKLLEMQKCIDSIMQCVEQLYEQNRRPADDTVHLLAQITTD